VVFSGQGGSGRSPRGTLVVLTLISITVIALDTFGFAPVQSLQSGVGTIFSPIKAVGDVVFGPVGDVWDATVNRRDLAEENEQLRQENAELEANVATQEQLEALLNQLAAAVNVDEAGEMPRVPAQLSSSSVSNFETEYEIDVGASDGIGPDMPVVVSNEEGNATLVGRVAEVSLSSARVQLITDPEFRAGVRILTDEGEGADIGVMRGQGEGDYPVVDTGIDAESNVQREDLVATSGDANSLFPPFLNVGRVVDTRDAPNPLEQEVLVDPLVNLDGLTFVTVLRTDQRVRAAPDGDGGTPPTTATTSTTVAGG
jgi:rod shape-determining protein MreC